MQQPNETKASYVYNNYNVYEHKALYVYNNYVTIKPYICIQ